MTTTIRVIGLPGLTKYRRFRPSLDDDGGKPRWKVEGLLYSSDGLWAHVVWSDSEEHALLAVLFLQQGGKVKVNGSIISDDRTLPRRHKIDRATVHDLTEDDAEDDENA